MVWELPRTFVSFICSWKVTPALSGNDVVLEQNLSHAPLPVQAIKKGILCMIGALGKSREVNKLSS